MQDWSTPLVLATAAFLILVLWRVRPAFPWAAGPRTGRDALRAARAAIEAASDDHARALALCDAADLARNRVAGPESASGLYLRAVRADPHSVDVVTRAVAGLAKRPRALESLLWRHLAIAPWRGEAVPAVRESLDALRVLYEGRLRNSARARALAHARNALG